MKAGFHLIRAKQKGVNIPLLAAYQEAKPPLDTSRLVAMRIHFLILFLAFAFPLFSNAQVVYPCRTAIQSVFTGRYANEQNQNLVVQSISIGVAETFDFIDLGGNNFAIQSVFTGRYANEQNQNLVVQSTLIGTAETFTLVPITGCIAPTSIPTPTPILPTPTPSILTPTPLPPTPTPTLPTPTPAIPLPPTGQGAQPGTDQPFIWSLVNPLRGLNNNAPPRDIFGAILLITDWILNIAGSLIVILIIYAGVRFVISRGNPGEIQKAKSILWWALIGYAVILIGKGFIFIVDSVLRGEIPTFL